MRALDDIDDATAAAFAMGACPGFGVGRNRPIRQIGEAVVRVALAHVQVDLCKGEKA